MSKISTREELENRDIFGVGAPNDAYAEYEVPGEENSNEWCEPVSDEDYGRLDS